MSAPSSPGKEAKEDHKMDAPAVPTSPAGSTPSSPVTEAKSTSVPTSPNATSPTSPKAASPVAEPATSSVTSPSVSAVDATAAPAPAADATPAAAAAAAPAPAPAAAPTIKDPKVAALHTMFPTVDPGVIEMVLESVGGSQDRAIESLLQMTDPEFKPDTATTQTEETTSQLNMDEEFARALHLQEQEEMRAPPRGSRSSASEIPAVLPYQPRVRRPRPNPQRQQSQHSEHGDPYAAPRDHDLDSRYAEPPAGHGPGGDPPGMIAFEDKLGQFAEAGKQTFNTFLTRAKAKYAELQEQHQTHRQGMQQVAGEWREQGAAGAGGPMVGAGERAKYGGLWGAPRSTETSPRATSPANAAGNAPANPVASARRWSPTDAYEDPTPPKIPSPGPGSRSTSPDKAAPNKIDLSKLGFLPKKKVDLMSTSTTEKDNKPAVPPKSVVDQIPRTPPAELSPHTLGDSDDDDDLEYTENPFERK